MHVLYMLQWLQVKYLYSLCKQWTSRCGSQRLRCNHGQQWNIVEAQWKPLGKRKKKTTLAMYNERLDVHHSPMGYNLCMFLQNNSSRLHWEKAIFSTTVCDCVFRRPTSFWISEGAWFFPFLLLFFSALLAQSRERRSRSVSHEPLAWRKKVDF